MSARAVWKFPVAIGTITTIDAPALAQVRFVALDPATGEPAIWIELDPSAGTVPRFFRIYGTGHEIEGDGGFPYPIHVGSVIHGALVWHIFEERC